MKKNIIALFLILAIIFIPSVTLTANARSVFSQYTTARTLTSGLNLQPTAVLEPENYSDIPSGSQVQSSGITSVLVTPNSDMDVEFKDKTVSFTDLFDAKLRRLFIPVLRLTAETVEPFIQMLKNTYYIADIVVLSSDVKVLDAIRKDSVATVANSVYDLTDVTLLSDRYTNWQYIAEANKVYANTVMFNGSEENFPVAAEYLSAMCKVCWAKTNSLTETVSAIASGATGVVVKNADYFKDAMAYFSKKGFAKAQNVAAHRGITSYANENSLTAVSSAISEGATHAEIDIQFTHDKNIVISHDSTVNRTTGVNASIEPTTVSHLKTFTLKDYSAKYEEAIPTLEEVIDAVSDTDLILIIELKLEDGRTQVVNKGAIEKFLEIMRAHPEMDGKWFCITFFRPYADKMRELAPEISVGFLGAGASGYENDQGIRTWDGEWTGMSNISSKIAFMHKFRMVLDETYTSELNTTAQDYLARGYLQNSWTFNNLNHFNSKLNIATSNVAEQCSMLIKEFTPTEYQITSQELASGKLKVMTENYCGWRVERTCDVITVSKEGNKVQILLYYNETAGSVSYGLYSQLMTYEII